MLLRAAVFLIAQQTDTRPPFWWIGLLASPGGLLIERLRTQLGLALTRGRRDVTMLVVRPAVEERDLGLNTDPR
jgi:hypothetical protein